MYESETSDYFMYNTPLQFLSCLPAATQLTVRVENSVDPDQMTSFVSDLQEKTTENKIKVHQMNMVQCRCLDIGCLP